MPAARTQPSIGRIVNDPLWEQAIAKHLLTSNALAFLEPADARALIREIHAELAASGAAFLADSATEPAAAQATRAALVEAAVARLSASSHPQLPSPAVTG